METNRITISNFRGVAGKTADDRNVRNHVLCRSSAPIPVMVQDTSGIGECGIRHIVGLRGDEERCAHAYQLSDAFVSHHISALKMRDGLENFYFFMLIDKSSTVEDIKRAASFMHREYRTLPFHDLTLALLLSLMEADDGAVLLHCNSGKDHTGVLTALLQKMLGIKEDVITQEYLLSNTYIPPDTLHHAEELGFQEDTRDMLVYCYNVHESLLRSSFDEMEKRYPGWEEFFGAKYGMSEKRIRNLKKRYLEPQT